MFVYEPLDSRRRGSVHFVEVMAGIITIIINNNDISVGFVFLLMV
jgi:hypothetical protein